MIYSLSSFLNNGEKEHLVKQLIAEFACAKNQDVERFLKSKAIDFERSHNARTYLMTDEHMQLLAYFSLSFKEITIDNEKVSKTIAKKLDGFNKNAKTMRVFLIGQIGKNSNLTNNKVTLQYIFEQIFNILLSVRNMIGGRAVILECQPLDKLLDLYHRHEFKELSVLDNTDMKTLYRVL